MVTAKTWSKNSCGLFDYESEDFIKKNLKVDCEGELTFVFFIHLEFYHINFYFLSQPKKIIQSLLLQ
jgi:hypothetical protein